MTQTANKYKYLPIKSDTKAELDTIGRKGQTYDQLISQLIRKWKEEN